MSKSKYPQFTTGSGSASYPYLNRPDTKFEEVYKVDLVLEAAKAKPLIKQINDYLKAYVQEVQKETKKKQDISKYRVPYEQNEDGTYTVKIKQRAEINGDRVQLTFFDSKGKRIEKVPAIFGGSTLKVSGSMRGYVSGANKGVTLGVYAVQVLTLAERQERGADSYGFGTEEDGYSFDESANDSSDFASDSEDLEDSDDYDF